MNAGNVAELPLQTRLAPIASVDTQKRTVELVWTTGARVKRYDFIRDRYYLEELSLDPKHVRMVRLASGKAPLLDNHSRFEGVRSVIGVVESAALGKEPRATVRFSQRDDVQPILRDVQDKIIRNVSCGYATYRVEMIPPQNQDDLWVYRAIDWEPYELSLVPIGADQGAYVRGREDQLGQRFPCEFISTQRKDVRTMKSGEQTQEASEETTTTQPPATAALNANAGRIRELATVAGLSSSYASQLIVRGLSLEEARTAIIDELAARDLQTQHRRADITTFENAGEPVTIVRDMSEMLVARYGGPAPQESARRYASARIVDMARELLELRGVRTTMLSRDQIIERSLHSGSDFPNLLQNTGNRLLRMGYDSYKGGAKVIAKQTTAPDFRAINRLSLGEAPALKKVLPGGEVTRGSMAEAKEAYTLATYARIFGINRQALINDDLGAFSQLGVKYGRAAAEFESQEIVNLLAANPVMGDGVALFHATHANKAGSPGAISVTTLGAAKQAMRLQKGLDGATPIDVTPRYLLVPAALEAVALQYVTQITPAQSSNVNPFAGQLEVVVDPRLDAISATAWYLAADSGTIDTVEYAYLQDAPGVQIESRLGFDIEGMEMKARLDFGCGVLDFRGLYLNG